jgi:hypothetical protein
LDLKEKKQLAQSQSKLQKTNLRGGEIQPLLIAKEEILICDFVVVIVVSI